MTSLFNLNEATLIDELGIEAVVRDRKNTKAEEILSQTYWNSSEAYLLFASRDTSNPSRMTEIENDRDANVENMLYGRIEILRNGCSRTDPRKWREQRGSPDNISDSRGVGVGLETFG